MNTPTEAHYDLRRKVIFSDADEGAQLIADSEARETLELRAALALGPENCDEAYDVLRADCDELRADVVRLTARAERAEAAETVALTHWNKELKRAMKAEADLAAAKERLRSEAMDDYASIKDLQRELAIERARLNWLETPSGMDWQWEPERLTVSRASIDAAMKENAK